MQFSNTFSAIALVLCKVECVQRVHLPEHVKMSIEQIDPTVKQGGSKLLMCIRFKNNNISSNLFTVGLHLREVFSTSGSSLLEEG